MCGLPIEFAPLYFVSTIITHPERMISSEQALCLCFMLFNLEQKIVIADAISKMNDTIYYVTSFRLNELVVEERNES